MNPTLAEQLQLETVMHSPAFQALQNRVAEFNQRKFPGQTFEGKLKHAIREIGEVIDNPDDDSEWADVLILFLAAAAMKSKTTTRLLEAAHAKVDGLELREWSAPDAEGVIEHRRKS